MKDLLESLDRRIRARGRRAAWEAAILGVVIVGSLDYLTGYEISMSLFYLAPVSLAAWYGGRQAGLVTAMVSCASWFLADRAAGHPYSQPAIPVWNAVVRLGFFTVTALLLAAIRELLDRFWHLSRTDAVAAADALMYEVKRQGKGAVGVGAPTAPGQPAMEQ